MTDNRKKLLIAKCDDLWRKVIRVLNGKEPDDKTVEAHHIFPRSNKSVRFDLANGYILTIAEHRVLKHHSHEAERFFINRIGEAEYRRLEQKSLKIKQWQEWELEEIVRQFKEILKGE